MNIISEKLLDTIKTNTEKISNDINLGTFEYYYNIVRDFIADNLIFIVIAYLFILPFIIRNLGFNFTTILIPPLLIIVYNAVKIALRTQFPFFNKLRSNQCLDKINHIIINHTIKPIDSFLNKPLHEFIISTSHNTYVPCNQNADVSSLEAIKRVLKMGARVIELDVYAKHSGGNTDDDYIPVIAHGIEKPTGDIFTTNPILFEDCIDTIVNFGFLTSDPLIVVLEINTNRLIPVQQKMKEIILRKLGNRLLDSSYKLNAPNRKLVTNENMQNLLNKVIFIGDGGKTSELDSVLDGIWGESNLRNHDAGDSELKTLNLKGVLTRVYPSGNVNGNFSLNYDPTSLWNNHYNLVALNFQTFDSNLMKNVSMFKNKSFVHFSEL